MVLSRFFTWFLFWFSGLLLAVAFAAEILIPGIVSDDLSSVVDRGIITQLILALFLFSLAINFKNTLLIYFQSRITKSGFCDVSKVDGNSQIAAKGLLGIHGERLINVFQRSKGSSEVSQTVSLRAIHNVFRRREWFVRSCGSLLITLGMVGTVLGLTHSLGGLSTTVNAVAQQANAKPSTDEAKTGDNVGGTEAESTDISSGLNQALGGMASAFVTTLMGAIFGGVFLRIISQCTDAAADRAVEDIEIETEQHLLPLLARNKKKSQKDSRLADSFDRFSQSTEILQESLQVVIQLAIPHLLYHAK